MMNENFTKADLKVGYVVKYRCGVLAMVMAGRNGKLITIDTGANYIRLEDVRENLTHTDDNRSDLDFVEVYGHARYNFEAMRISTNDRELLWKREEAKKMTISEIEKILGYKVEVVADVLEERGSYGN